METITKYYEAQRDVNNLKPYIRVECDDDNYNITIFYKMPEIISDKKKIDYYDDLFRRLTKLQGFNDVEIIGIFYDDISSDPNNEKKHIYTFINNQQYLIFKSELKVINLINNI